MADKKHSKPPRDCRDPLQQPFLSPAIVPLSVGQIHPGQIASACKDAGDDHRLRLATVVILVKGWSLAAEWRLCGISVALGRCGSRRVDPIRRRVQFIGIPCKLLAVRLLAQARRHLACALRQRAQLPGLSIEVERPQHFRYPLAPVVSNLPPRPPEMTPLAGAGDAPAPIPATGGTIPAPTK